MSRTMFSLVFVAAMGAAIAGGMFYAFSSFVMRGLARTAAALLAAVLFIAALSVIG